MEGQSRHIPTPRKDKAEPSISEHLITQQVKLLIRRKVTIYRPDAAGRNPLTVLSARKTKALDLC